MEMTLWKCWTELKREGVIIPIYGANAENCFIDGEAKIGQNTIIWPNVTIDNGVVIGENCEIGKGATIVGKIKIGNHVVIGHHVKITGKGYIGENCKIKSDINNPGMKKNCKVLTSA